MTRPSLFLVIIILTETVAVLSRKGGHFSKIVSVGVFPGKTDSELQVNYPENCEVISTNKNPLQVFIGTLELLLMRRDDLLQSLVTRSVGGVVMGHLAGTFYSGVVTEKQDCGVRMWIRDMELVSGNIDCKRKHFVLEPQKDGQYVMTKKSQSHVKPDCNGGVSCEEVTIQRVCTLYIHTDPFLWAHVREGRRGEEETKEAIIRSMVDHIMAANQMYDKVKTEPRTFDRLYMT